MAGVRHLTKEEKELLSLFGKPITVYHSLQAFTRDKPRLLPRCLSYKIQARRNKMANPGGITIYNYMNCDNIILRSEIKRKTSCPFCPMKCGSLKGVKYHLTSSHDLFDFNFRLSENGHPNFDVSVKPDAFENGVLNYGLEGHHLVNYSYCSKTRMRDQVNGPKGRRRCNIFEKYSDVVPRDKANELTHENGNVSSSLARTRLSEATSGIQTITQPEIGQRCKAAKGPRPMARKTVTPRAIGRKKCNPQRVQTEKRTDPLKSRQFYHSRTLQPMTLEEVMSDADSDDEHDEEYKDLLERLKLDRLEDASDESKSFMWLWNTFIRKQRVLVDKHIPWACVEFIKVHAKELITRNLFSHWRTFAVETLCLKYGLINGKTMDNCSIILQKAREEEEAPEEAATAAEVAAAAEEEEAEKAAAAAAAAAKVAAAAAAKVAADAAAKAASACKATRRSARTQNKKKKQEAAATSKANADKPQPMELDEEEH